MEIFRYTCLTTGCNSVKESYTPLHTKTESFPQYCMKCETKSYREAIKQTKLPFRDYDSAENKETLKQQKLKDKKMQETKNKLKELRAKRCDFDFFSPSRNSAAKDKKMIQLNADIMRCEAFIKKNK